MSCQREFIECFPVMPTSLEKFRRARVHPPRKLVWEGSASLDMVRIQLVTSSCAGRLAFEKAKGDRVSEENLGCSDCWSGAQWSRHRRIFVARRFESAGPRAARSAGRRVRHRRNISRLQILHGCVSLFSDARADHSRTRSAAIRLSSLRERTLRFFTPFPDGRHLTMWQDRAKDLRRDCEIFQKRRCHVSEV